MNEGNICGEFSQGVREGDGGEVWSETIRKADALLDDGANAMKVEKAVDGGDDGIVTGRGSVTTEIRA